MWHEPLRIVVTGGRNFRDRKMVESTLGQFRGKNVLLAEGEARGADTLCRLYADTRYWPVCRFPADWAKYGKRAGFIRNQQMIDEFRPDVCVAFPGGRGTADMVQRCRKAGLLIIEAK